MSIIFAPFRPGIFENPGWKWDEERRVFENPKFGQVFHTVFYRDGVAQNDQMLRVEKSPGCFIPLNQEGHVGLVRHAFRPQIRDHDLHDKHWPYEDPNDLTGNIGRPSWEIPRGYANLGESGSQTASREAEEETGSAIVASSVLGKVCGNTAMEPHFMTVVVGLVDQTRAPTVKADPNEKLLRGLEFFPEVPLRDLIRKGELYCAYTLSALSLLEANGGAARMAKFHLRSN